MRVTAQMLTVSHLLKGLAGAGGRGAEEEEEEEEEGTMKGWRCGDGREEGGGVSCCTSSYSARMLIRPTRHATTSRASG